MANQTNEPTPQQPVGRSVSEDLPDNQHDLERMKSETVTLDLPDVKDIPGQENITVPPLGEMADTTISSDDEEGIGLFDDAEEDEDADIIMNTDTDVSPTERLTLERTDEDMPTDDDQMLRMAALDNQDFEGEELNEGSLATDVSGADLDESGTDADDPMESIGEEDEENNHYSLGSGENDNVNEGTP
jgi:hypothetical protein